MDSTLAHGNINSEVQERDMVVALKKNNVSPNEAREKSLDREEMNREKNARINICKF